jgi:hypothetical protein
MGGGKTSMTGPAFEIDVGTDDKPVHRLPRRFETLEELLSLLPTIIKLNVDATDLTLVIRSVK